MDVDFNEWYRDQAPIYGWPVSAIYLELGIRRMDGEFCRRICALKTQKEAAEVMKDLERNKHLHEKIKENLRANLVRKIKEISADV